MPVLFANDTCESYAQLLGDPVRPSLSFTTDKSL